MAAHVNEKPDNNQEEKAADCAIVKIKNNNNNNIAKSRNIKTPQIGLNLIINSLYLYYINIFIFI